MSHILKKDLKSTKRYEITFKSYTITQTKSRLPRNIQLQKFAKCLSWIIHKQVSTTFTKLRSFKFSVFTRYNIKPIQQFVLSIQKKAFTRRLWAFYKMKNYNERKSLPATLNTRRSSPSYSQNFKSFDFLNSTQEKKPRRRGIFPSKVSKFVSILNKILLANKMKCFSYLHLWVNREHTYAVSANLKIRAKLFNLFEILQQKRKIWALSQLILCVKYIPKKVNQITTRSFLSYTRPSSKLITLPTIFLDGDPGPNSCQESHLNSVNRRRHSFKYFT